MAAAVPFLSFFDVHEPEVRFMHQRRCLESLSRLFAREPLGSELAQLVVHERQKLVRCMRVALLNGGQDASHVGHGTSITSARPATISFGVRSAYSLAAPRWTIEPDLSIGDVLRTNIGGR